MWGKYILHKTFTIKLSSSCMPPPSSILSHPSHFITWLTVQLFKSLFLTFLLHPSLPACLWLWLSEAKFVLMALCLSGPSGTSLSGFSSDQFVAEVPLRQHLDCTNTTGFWSISGHSVSLWWVPLQSADPGGPRAVGGPWGWRRDREQTSVTTLLPHCPAAC